MMLQYIASDKNMEQTLGQTVYIDTNSYNPVIVGCTCPDSTCTIPIVLVHVLSQCSISYACPDCSTSTVLTQYTCSTVHVLVPVGTSTIVRTALYYEYRVRYAMYNSLSNSDEPSGQARQCKCVIQLLTSARADS